jgi:hypothetical protein
MFLFSALQHPKNFGQYFFYFFKKQLLFVHPEQDVFVMAS